MTEQNDERKGASNEQKRENNNVYDVVSDAELSGR